MTAFVCRNCNYRFESEKNHEGKRCPYCNREGIIKEPSAEDLIREN
jgi:DNA-directed RNA polymerase subunit RPC12/RpoP